MPIIINNINLNLTQNLNLLTGNFLLMKDVSSDNFAKNRKKDFKINFSETY